jgi:hypothetical protein
MVILKYSTIVNLKNIRTTHMIVVTNPKLTKLIICLK